MWDRVQNVLRHVSAFLGKVEGRHSKCPRCKGSGLLSCSTAWQWNLPPASNEPCWFCEGVGVMPIIGLNGFVIARAAPVFQTRDCYLPSHLPINLQLCLGKFPGSKCKLTTFKPDGEFHDLLHDFDRRPLWLNKDGDWESGQHSLSDSQSVSSIRYQNIFQARVKPPAPLASNVGSRQQYQSFSKSSQSSKGNGNRSSKFSRQYKSPKTQCPKSTPSAPSYDPKNPYLRSNHIRLPCPTSPKKKTDYLNDGESRNEYTGSGLYAAASVGSPGKGSIMFIHTQAQIDINQFCETVKQSLGKSQSRPSSPLITSPRSPRSPRRERNRIREKAEKEAFERARRIQRPLTPGKDQLITSDDRSESLQSFINRNFREAAGTWYELQNGKGHSIPSTLSSQAPSIKRLALSGQSWINELVYGRVQGTLNFPRLGKL